MHRWRNWILISLILLMIISIYIDLSVGTPISTTIHQKNEKEMTSPNHYEQYSDSFQVISYHFQNGDTLLSVFDHFHSNEQSINIEQALTDFQALNPTTNIYQLKAETTYLFPVYQNEGNN